MSYLNYRAATTRWVQYTPNATTPPTISSGSVILWDTSTKKTTGGDSVSVNASTGLITFSASHRYLVQASIQIDRNANGGYSLEWQNSSGTTITPADGGFPVRYEYKVSVPIIDSSLVATLALVNPTDTYKLVCTSVDANSTVNPNTELLIWELY